MDENYCDRVTLALYMRPKPRFSALRQKLYQYGTELASVSCMRNGPTCHRPEGLTGDWQYNATGHESRHSRFNLTPVNKRERTWIAEKTTSDCTPLRYSGSF